MTWFNSCTVGGNRLLACCSVMGCFLWGNDHVRKGWWPFISDTLQSSDCKNICTKTLWQIPLLPCFLPFPFYFLLDWIVLSSKGKQTPNLNRMGEMFHDKWWFIFSHGDMFSYERVICTLVFGFGLSEAIIDLTRRYLSIHWLFWPYRITGQKKRLEKIATAWKKVSFGAFVYL